MPICTSEVILSIYSRYHVAGICARECVCSKRHGEERVNIIRRAREMLGIRTGLTQLRLGVMQLSIKRTLTFNRPFVCSSPPLSSLSRTLLLTERSPQSITTIFKRTFFQGGIQKNRWSQGSGADWADRYMRLNRFQRYQGFNGGGKNDLRSLTLFGVSAMVVIFFGSKYLFEYVPGFTHFRNHPRDLIYALLGVNLGVFLLWQVPRFWPFLQKYMLLEKGTVASKWSLIGSTFSHQEFWHLGMNMLALWSFGTGLASMLGTANFFSLYMNSAIFGSLVSLWYPRIARMMVGPSLGASGALFGVFGCFAYLVPNAKILFFVIPFPGGAWLAFLASMLWNGAGCALRWGSFDYAAHLGGSIIGVFYGWLITKQIERRKKRRMAIMSGW